MLDLHRLRLLREVSARGTVHGAARALGYTPSAISQQLGVLEREAGATLLERVGRNVRLTPAGQVLVRHAGVLLDAVEAAEAEVAGVATETGLAAGGFDTDAADGDGAEPSPAIASSIDFIRPACTSRKSPNSKCSRGCCEY